MKKLTVRVSQYAQQMGEFSSKELQQSKLTLTYCMFKGFRRSKRNRIYKARIHTHTCIYTHIKEKF